MLVNLYYAPYPSQYFEGADKPISPVRTRIAKSSLETLVSGTDKFLKNWGLNVNFKIINTQLDENKTWYKSFPYGPQILHCYRNGGAYEQYDSCIREAQVHGLTNNFTNSAAIVGSLAQHIKKIAPNSLVIAGGIDVSARPEYYIDNGVDIVILLEGEYSFAKVLQAYIKGVDIQSCMPCRKYKNGIIISGNEHLCLDDLEPMNLELIKNNLEFYDDTGEGIPPSTVRPPFLCFETSRGCYQACPFCATPIRGRYRFMSAKTVEKHFKHFRKYGINNLLFQEDNILSRIHRTGKGDYLHDAGRKEVIKIFKLAREHDFSWEFANGLEFGKFLDSGKLDVELMEALLWSDRNADRWQGCYRVQLSLEYLGDPTKSNLPKLRRFEEELDILKKMIDLDVTYLTFNVIIGHEGDDNNSINGYLNRCLKLKQALLDHDKTVVPYFNIYNRALLPGSKDFERKKHLLKFNIDMNPEVICLFLSATDTSHLSYYELVEKRQFLTQELNGNLIEEYDGVYVQNP